MHPKNELRMELSTEGVFEKTFRPAPRPTNRNDRIPFKKQYNGVMVKRKQTQGILEKRNDVSGDRMIMTKLSSQSEIKNSFGPEMMKEERVSHLLILPFYQLA